MAVISDGYASWADGEAGALAGNGEVDVADAAPDPAQARTLDEFVVQLRLLKAWVGDPSITRITQRIHRAWQAAGRPRSEWPARATVGYCLRTSRRRPNPDLLLAVVAALVDGEPAAVDAWRQSLRVVMREAESAGRVSASDTVPADIADFTGRAEIISTVTAMVSDTTAAGVVCTVEGMAGIGKTALVVHLAHQLVDVTRRDERALFVNLRGADPHHPPVSPAAVLASFLRLLNVPGERIPHTLAGRVSLYRRQLAGTRTLVVLDNAAGTDQIASLLPETTGCPVLVTSRSTLHGMPAAHQVRLPGLTRGEAIELLRRTAGTDRVDADAVTPGEIADRLGYLPLALSVVGRHLRDHPDWTLTDYLPALTALVLEGGLRAALALSDRAQAAPARRLLRLLALHPGTDIDVAAATALSGQATSVTRGQLDALVTANLLAEREPGRYALHNLTRAYATERVRVDHPATHVEQALTRLLDHYAGAAARPRDAIDVAHHAAPWGSRPTPPGRLASHRQAPASARFTPTRRTVAPP